MLGTLCLFIETDEQYLVTSSAFCAPAIGSPCVPLALQCITLDNVEGAMG